MNDTTQMRYLISGVVSVDNKTLNRFSNLHRLGIHIDLDHKLKQDQPPFNLADIIDRNAAIEELDITAFLPNTLLTPRLAYHAPGGSHLNLVHLSIAVGQQPAVQLIADVLQNLRSLHLTGTGDNINQILNNNIVLLPNLRFLTLSLVSHRLFHDKEVYTTLGYFVVGCPNLERLWLSRAYRNWNHDEAIFESICEILPKLKRLRVLVIELFTIPHIPATNFTSNLPESLEVLSFVMGELEPSIPVSDYH